METATDTEKSVTGVAATVLGTLPAATAITTNVGKLQHSFMVTTEAPFFAYMLYHLLTTILRCVNIFIYSDTL